MRQPFILKGCTGDCRQYLMNWVGFGGRSERWSRWALHFDPKKTRPGRPEKNDSNVGSTRKPQP